MITKSLALRSIDSFAQHVAEVGYDRAKKHHLTGLFAVMRQTFIARGDRAHEAQATSLQEEFHNDRLNCKFVCDVVGDRRINGRFEPKPEAQFGVATIDDTLNKLRKLAAFLPESLPPTAPRPSSYQDLSHLNKLVDVAAIASRVQND